MTGSKRSKKKKEACAISRSSGEKGSGTLYVCGTPIGNLEDITLRALRILREADVIAAEDTRRTKQLCGKYQVRARLISYREHNKQRMIPQILRLLEEGKNVALVSDSGMPGISDPGAELVSEASKRFSVVVVPGPSSLTAALSIAGMKVESFLFEGFLPRKKAERMKRLESLKEIAKPLVFFEAPHRIKDTVRAALDSLGDRPAVLCRELTKVHEEVLRGTLASILERLNEGTPQGEMVLIIGGAASKNQEESEGLMEESVDEVMRLMSTGLSRSAAVRDVASERGLDRQALYRKSLAREEKGRG